MRQLSRQDLFSLEQYALVRPEFRAKVMAHKQARKVHVGPHATLYFEDALTMQYQVQEMLRVERIFEAEGIDEELAAYNPLIPDGHNWKATLMLEYGDIAQRKAALARMVGIEDRVWAQVDGFEKVWAIADEDLERNTDGKTSAVHFLRFELAPGMVTAVKSGTTISVGLDHASYAYQVPAVPDNARASLAADLD